MFKDLKYVCNYYGIKYIECRIKSLSWFIVLNKNLLGYTTLLGTDWVPDKGWYLSSKEDNNLLYGLFFAFKYQTGFMDSIPTNYIIDTNNV